MEFNVSPLLHVAYQTKKQYGNGPVTTVFKEVNWITVRP